MSDAEELLSWAMDDAKGDPREARRILREALVEEHALYARAMDLALEALAKR